MRGDANAVPLGQSGLEHVDAPLRAQVHDLIDRLPSHVLVAILPVLQKYAAELDPPETDRPKPDPNRITIHYGRR